MIHQRRNQHTQVVNFRPPNIPPYYTVLPICIIVFSKKLTSMCTHSQDAFHLGASPGFKQEKVAPREWQENKASSNPTPALKHTLSHQSKPLRNATLTSPYPQKNLLMAEGFLVYTDLDSYCLVHSIEPHSRSGDDWI